MFADNYTPLDHAYNATLRLINKLHHIRDLLKECDQVLSGEVVFESVNGLGDIVQQMGEELTTLEWMIKDVEKWWKPLELSVSEAVGRLKIETPPDSVTWTQHVIDKAWRAFNGMDVQLKIHKDAEKVIKGMISWTPKMGALSDITEWNQRITKEFRAGGVVPQDAGPKTSIEQEALKAIIDGKMAGVLNAAKKIPAQIRVDKAMDEMFWSDPLVYSRWRISDWTGQLHCHRSFVCNSKTRTETIPNWKAANADLYAQKVPKRTGRKLKPTESLEN
ncbi:MAG: hypothetical protein NTY42_11245 [Planctomycetota bacterium]|nr:hypothetical protein [Planctomycetota bacterium]